MGKSKIPSPTVAELAILQVLWQRGVCTVREVHQALKPTQSTGYTTKLKLMQVMCEKGLVLRDQSQRAHIYRAAISRNQTERRVVKDIVERVFGGSARNLVMQALNTKKVSDEELKQVREFLDDYLKES